MQLKRLFSKYILFFTGSLIYFAFPVFTLANPVERSINAFHFVLTDVRAPIFSQKTESDVAVRTSETIDLKKGQIVKVDRADDNSYWIEVKKVAPTQRSTTEPMAKGTRDFVVVPNTIFERGTATNGTSYTIPHSTLQLIGPEFPSNEPQRIRITNADDEIADYYNIVYYESMPGRRVSITRSPELDSVRCGSTGGVSDPCTAWPTTGDDLLIRDSLVHYIYLPNENRYQARLYYKVSFSYCARQDHSCTNEQLKFSEGWIHANRVSYTKRPAIAGLIKSDKFGGAHNRPFEAPLTTSQKEAFVVLGQSLAPDYMKQYRLIIANAKRTLEQDNSLSSGSSFNALVSKGIGVLDNQFFGATNTTRSPYNKVIKAHYDTLPTQNHRSTDTSNEELNAMDAIARTIYGEIRSDIDEIDTGYAKAIAKVIINRAAYIHVFGPPKDANWVSAVNPGRKGDSILKLLVEVVGNDRQFSIFNRGDSNLAKVFSPDRYSTQWRASVDVAYFVVKNLKAFINETIDINSTRYFSHLSVAPWKDGTSQTKFIIGGTTYGVDINGRILSLDESPVNLFNDKLNDKVKIAIQTVMKEK